MGYTATGSLEDLFDVEPFEESEKRVARRVGHFLHERVESHTPVAQHPPGVPMGEWLRSRGGRPPRTLRDSWRMGLVERDPNGYHVDVFTEDPIAPFVEFPTAAHLIVPKDPDGWLRWWDKFGRIHFARAVMHPGTEGSYMMEKALAETEVEWETIAEEEFVRLARTY